MTPIRLPSVTGLMSAAVQIATVRLAEGARRNARGELEARAALARDGDEVTRALRAAPYP